jgi:hypothetical protein
MAQQQQLPALKRGQFLWMEPAAQRRYVQQLKKRISDGYYNSENVFSKVAEEIAPVLEEVAGCQ